MACKPIRIACVGDSLTRGDGSHERRQQKNLKGRGNFPKYLDSLLNEEKGQFIVRNFGHGGTTACNTSDSPFIQTREFRRAVRFRPHLLVLMLGTNDAKDKNWDVSSRCSRGADSLASGLSQIVGAFREPQPATLVLEPPPIQRERWGIRKRLLPLARNAVNDWYNSRAANTTSRGECAAGGIWLTRSLPASNDMLPKLFVADGVHLNEAGSKAAACAVHHALVGKCSNARLGLGKGSTSGTGSESDASAQCALELRDRSECFDGPISA